MDKNTLIIVGKGVHFKNARIKATDIFSANKMSNVHIKNGIGLFTIFSHEIYEETKYKLQIEWLINEFAKSQNIYQDSENWVEWFNM